MARSKLTLTLEQDDESGTDEGMARTIELLSELGITPATKLVLTLECEEEDSAIYRDDLKAALRRRPIGIKATIKTETKEEAERERLVPVTPMDRAGWDAMTGSMEWTEAREDRGFDDDND